MKALAKEGAAYVIVGILNTLGGLVVFALLNQAGFPSSAIWSQIFAAHVVMVPLAFFMQAKFVFKKRPRAKSASLFLVLSCITLLANQVLFPIVRGIVVLGDLQSQSIALIFSAVIGYLAGKYITFRS